MGMPDIKELQPLAVLPVRSDDFEDAEQRRAIEAAVGRRRRSTRVANLGTFSGYRIGLDIGNGNIGWAVLFEERPDGGPLRLRFLTAEDIVAHNRALPRSAPRTQLPDLRNFVPLGVHKFEARESQQKGEKSHSKIRAEARARRRALDARQTRRMYVKKALQDAGLLPTDGEALEGATKVKADILRVKLLDPAFPAHRHDLGRALYNVLKRRGWMPPVGRTGIRESSGFGEKAEADYRQALADFGCRTIGEFLERCARDARRDRVRFRKRHSSLAWQEEHKNQKPKDLTTAKSYEVFRFLTPTFVLVWEEADAIRLCHSQSLPIADHHWKALRTAAEFRRSLRPRSPGRCRYFRTTEFRCVRALPSFQRFRILEQVTHLRDRSGSPLDDDSFKQAVGLLENRDKIRLAALSQALGSQALRFDKGDYEGRRTLIGAVTDTAMAKALGDVWRALPIKARDEWTLRFLRRHPLDGQGQSDSWSLEDDQRLERDAEAAFGRDALKKVDEHAARALEDTFSAISLKAARLLADCYARRLSYDERMAALREAGAPEPRLELYERLPYYGVVMPDQTVGATAFAPAERTCAEELAHGRAPNPDLHIVLNRLRAVVNAIIEMMGGILPTRCVVEMARSALSEEQANEHRQRAWRREALHRAIVAEIKAILGPRTPVGPALERLIERWKAAERQGWRDYDGSEIPRSGLIDGSTYQLDHVVPAAFGDFRENNMFVSRHNAEKGRRLPWQAFEDKDQFKAALLAFATFGVEQRIAVIQGALRRSSAKRRNELEEALDRARRDQDRLSEQGTPHPDVLTALRRTVSGRRAAPAAGDDNAGPVRTFEPGDQAALFGRFHPDRKPPQGGPAARDIANIGWSTKLALRYLRHLGAETEAIKAWAVHALRCMFGINKCREDLRNHAVDAFLVAHFDKELLQPAFARLRHEFGYEALYEPRALEAALSHFAGGVNLLGDFRQNLDRLGETLPLIGTAHRPDHKWNPGDGIGSGLGAFGGENIYSFRPTLAVRTKLTSILAEGGLVPKDASPLSKRAILAFLQHVPADRKAAAAVRRLKGEVTVSYRSGNGTASTETTAKYATSLPIKGLSGAFIDASGKFCATSASKNRERRILDIVRFAAQHEAQRRDLFADRQSIVYRRGDTVIHDGKGLVVTGIEADGRLTCFPVDTAKPERRYRVRPTVPLRETSPALPKLGYDVLGRQLHRLRKDPGGIKPVPYRLRG